MRKGATVSGRAGKRTGTVGNGDVAVTEQKAEMRGTFVRIARVGLGGLVLVALLACKRGSESGSTKSLKDLLGAKPSIPANVSKLRLLMKEDEARSVVPELGEPALGSYVVTAPEYDEHVSVFVRPHLGRIKTIDVVYPKDKTQKEFHQVLIEAWGEPVRKTESTYCWTNPAEKIRAKFNPQDRRNKDKTWQVRLDVSYPRSAFFAEAKGQPGFGAKALLGSTPDELTALAESLHGKYRPKSKLFLTSGFGMGCGLTPTLTIHLDGSAKVVGWKATSLPSKDKHDDFYAELDQALGKPTDTFEVRKGVTAWVYSGRPRKVLVESGRARSLEVGVIDRPTEKPSGE